MIEARIEELERKHATLEEKLDSETHRPLPDQQVIAELKRKKLRLKDQIAEMQRD